MKISTSKSKPVNDSSVGKSGLMTILLGGLCVILIVTVYVWIISAGQWTNWRTPTAYYYRLAQSFDNGQLSLQDPTDPRLLTLSDPYENTDLRKSITFPWDASFYNGKFYFYWGPTPALILSLIIPFYGGAVGDHYVFFVFLIGLLFLNILILKTLWDDYFKTLPLWIFFLCILLIGLVNPIPWITNRHAIYEAAIASGQFFFVGGLYWVYTAFKKSPLSRWRLVIAGIFWAFAFGSRAIIVLPIAFMVCLIWLGIARMQLKTLGLAQTVSSCAALGSPIVLGGLAVAWYNWARFGSFFEFGLRFQLNDTNLNKYFNEVFSGSYIYSNFYNYLLAHTFKNSNIFPFIIPRGGKSLLGNGIANQGIYQVHGIEGLLIVFPFVIFAIIPAIVMVLSVTKGKAPSENLFIKNGIPPVYLFALLGASLLGFLPALLFFWADMRYMFDFVPELALLAILGFWQGYYFFSNKPVLKNLTAALGLALAAFSIVIGVLVAAPRP